MFTWLKQFFCDHKWECQGDPLSDTFKPLYKCAKCDKEEGL